MSMTEGTMKTIILWTCSVLFFASSIQGLDVAIEPRGEVVVLPGSTLNISCKTDIQAHSCRYEAPHRDPMIYDTKDLLEKGFQYIGSGLEKGDCSIQIKEVVEENNGEFKCEITGGVKGSGISYAKLNIIVAMPPRGLILGLSQGNSDRYTYRVDERITMTCNATYARPYADMSLYLGDELISGETKQGNVTAIHTVRSEDFGKTVRCVAKHVGLSRPLERTEKIIVQFEPLPNPIKKEISAKVGMPGYIRVIVKANPAPHFEWLVDGDSIHEGQSKGNNHLRAANGEDMGDGQFMAQLTIDTVQQSDVDKDYVLKAVTNIGAVPYHIKVSKEGIENEVSSSSGIDALTITGIVLAALVVVFVVFLVVFARATGRWCFAGGSSVRNIGESDVADPAASIRLLRFYKPKEPKSSDANSPQRSDTESAGRYSRSEVDSSSGRPRRPRLVLSQLFRRNKDKVSGTDTDTMRTVITVDEEKIPETTDVTGKANPEGGLVYAELDLGKKEIAPPPRRVSEDKTEYAEILYTKPDNEENSDKK